MRLTSIEVKDALPVRLFQANDLADVVVLAGPNGVGKTRLLDAIVNHLRSPGGGEITVQAKVSATVGSEQEAWGKLELDLTDPEDAARLAQTLQVGRRRRKWSSSLVNFESDRSIRNLQPLQWTWDMEDPEEEDISWDLTFGFMRDRFQDTLHSIFRMIEGQKQKIANRAVQLKREGHDSMRLGFADPMEEFKRVFEMLLGPKRLADPQARLQRLQYIQGDQTLDFETLSSGEREVVNIAFDFLLRQPRDCIVFFDEPELHLHPELSYKLLRTLRSVGERNQFVLSTHSPEIISSSLDQSVTFISPAKQEPDGTWANQAIPVLESDETNQALRLLGQSIGIVALGKRIVLIEGEESSLDKQTYGSILGDLHPDLVLVPSGGKHVIESFDTVYEAVLNRTLWGVEFFMLCDGDSAPPASAAVDNASAQGRLRRLSRYHLENYFLDEHVWAEAFATMEPENAWLRDPAQIRAQLREIASQFVSYAVALSASSSLRRRVGNVDLMPKDCHGKSVEETQNLFLGAATGELDRVREVLDGDAVRQEVEDAYVKLETAISTDSDNWKALIPGKQVLATFARRAGLSPSRAKAMYVSAAEQSSRNPFEEIVTIFDAMTVDPVQAETPDAVEPVAAQ
jgi:ABC-type cobalamin/Fe3+-siderophores transport system ATPase subunit